MISKLWHLSLKMLSAKKGRTFFSILAIALGVGLLCSVFQLQIMFNQDLQQRLDNEFGSADIRISSPAPTNGDEWNGLDTSLLKEIHNFDRIQSIGQALEGKMVSRISYKNQSAFIDDANFHYVGVDNEKVTKEYYKFKKDLSDYEVALSESLADHWNVEISDSIEIDLLDGSSVVWKVAEVVQPTQNREESNENWIFFHLGSLQEVMGLQETVNPMLVELKPKANISFIGYDLERELPREVRVDALHGLEEEEEIYTFFHIYGYILSIIAFIASAILVYSLMQTTYRERLKELAVIRAVGGSTEQLLKMVIYEWALISAIGSILGFILAGIFSGYGIIWVAKLIHLELVIETYSTGSIGMVITAFVSWLAILLASLGVVRKVIQTDPVQSFRESLDSPIDTERGKVPWWIIVAVAGLLLWLVNYLISDDTSSIRLINIKVLSSMIGGLLLCIALLSRTVWLGVALLRFIVLLPDWLASRSLKLSAQRLIVEKSQISIVILMALVIMVSVPVATMYLSAGNTASVDKSEYLNADFFVHAEQEFFLTSAAEMPWYLKHEIEAIEGVEKVMPLPVTQFAEMDENKYLSGSREEEAILRYIVTDLRSLAEWNLASLPDDALENAGVLPKDIAEELGIEIGDTISIIIDDQPTSVVIVDITDKMDGLHQHASALMMDESHPAVQTLNLREIYIGMKDGYEEQLKQALSLLQREYPEMRWGHKAEAMSSFETTRQQILMMLLGLTVIIIFCGTGGVLNAINAGIHARRREYAVLRSIFLTPFQMVKIVVWQGVLLSILSIMMGTATATILFFSIYNLASAFRTIFMQIPLVGVGILYFIIFILTVMATLPMAGKIARMKIMDIFKTDG